MSLLENRSLVELSLRSGCSISALKWPMGGAVSEFEGHSLGRVFLESTVKGEEHQFIAEPMVWQAVSR